MSLARTALRLAVVEALNADPMIDALCQGRIYDSRIGQFSNTEPVPVITVLTEDDGGEAFSANNGGPPFDERCELSIEIGMRLVTDVDGESAVGIVETDRDLEAHLDLIEHRAVEAVTVAHTPASRLIRAAVTRRVSAYKSVRFVSDETSMKLAVRIVQLTVELKGVDQADATDEAPTGPFATLPDPLRTVAEALPTGSSGQATCLRLTAMLGPEPRDAFEGASLAMSTVTLRDEPPDPADDADRLTNAEVELPNWMG